MEEFFPGLIKVMEERLGRFGRPLTIFVVICLAVGASSWGLKMFWDNLVYPASQFVKIILEVNTTNELLREVATPLGLYIIGCVVIYFIFLIVGQKLIFKPAKRVTEDATRVTENAIRIIEEMNSIRREIDELMEQSKKSVGEEINKDEGSPNKERNNPT